MRILSGTVGVVVLCFMSGRSAETHQQQDDYHRYAALQVGLAVKYKTTDTDPQGRQNVVEFTMTCTRRENVGGVDTYPLEFRLLNKVEKTIYLAVDAEGVKAYRYKEGEQDNVFRTPDLYVKFPPVKGDSWEWEGMESGRKVKRTHRHEGEETVEVPVGKYRCLKLFDETFEYHAADDSWKRIAWGNRWYAKDRGMVKMDLHFVVPDGEFHESIEMHDFKVSPKPSDKK